MIWQKHASVTSTEWTDAFREFWSWMTTIPSATPSAFSCRTHGIEVVVAQDGESAIEIFQSQGPFDVVITDLGMPGMDGSTFARSIWAEQPQQKIAVVSGWSADEVRSRFHEDHMPDFVLYKPRIGQELEKLVLTSATSQNSQDSS